MTEHAVAQSSCQAFVYDPTISNWKPLAEGMVNIYIYHHPVNKSYRVIGMNGQNQAVINSSLFPEVKYAHSNNVFHTWTDAQFAYGIHFANEELAKKFSADFASCLSSLAGEGSGGDEGAPPPPPDNENTPSTGAPGAPEPPPSGGGGMSFAEQLAAKKAGGLKKAEERKEPDNPPIPPAGAGGGGIMGDLANVLAKRKSMAKTAPVKEPKPPVAEEPKVVKAAEPKVGGTKDSPASASTKVAHLRSEGGGSNPGSPAGFRKKTVGSKAPSAVAPQPNGGGGGGGGGGGSGLKKEDLDKFKEELMTAFKEELKSFKEELMAEISEKLAAAGSGSANVMEGGGDYEEEEMYYGEEEN